jgi:50S ribosomal protein L16 3-hydroxylase
VQGVDRLLPAVAAILEPFRFLPDWRIDDVMVSFAPRFGSVGPHVDSYDVFLIQGLGRRRWRIDSRAVPDFRPGLGLRILRRFSPEAEWVLEPGDMLYLPPGVGHHGIALEDGLTFSIGFRAPTSRELLAALLRTSTREAAYRDPGRGVARRRGEIHPAELAAQRQLVRAETVRALRSGASWRAPGSSVSRARGWPSCAAPAASCSSPRDGRFRCRGGSASRQRSCARPTS